MSTPAFIPKSFSSLIFGPIELPDVIQDVCLSLVDNETVYDALRQIQDPTSDLYKQGCLELAKRDLDLLNAVNRQIFNDENWVLKALKAAKVSIYRLDILSDLCKLYSQNKAIMREALKHDGGKLQYASEALKNDKEIVLAVVHQNGWALEFASQDLKNDRDVVLAAVSTSQSGDALHHASEALKNDKEVVSTAVNQNCHALFYASQDLKNDRDVVLTAVRQNGEALQYASETLKNDKSVVLAAVNNNFLALHHASEALQNDKSVVSAFMKIFDHT